MKNHWIRWEPASFISERYCIEAINDSKQGFEIILFKSKLVPGNISVPGHNAGSVSRVVVAHPPHSGTTTVVPGVGGGGVGPGGVGDGLVVLEGVNVIVGTGG